MQSNENTSEAADSRVNAAASPAVNAEASSAAQPASNRRHQVLLALKILAGLLIIAAPVLVAANFVPGLFSVAFFGVLAAVFGWVSGGPKVGVSVVAALAGLGVVVILLREQVWALALILVLLGVLYGYAGSRGVGKAVLQLPILTPYFIMSPPALFASPPEFGPAYFFGFVAILLATGVWAIAVLHFATGARVLKLVEVPDKRVPWIYGTVLGVISAVVMVIGMTSDLKTHWVWVTLTLYVLADPSQLMTLKKLLGRLLGTFAGFGVVTLLLLISTPDRVLQILAILALWLCVYFMIIKRPYWQYSLFLTVAVVLTNASGVNTLLLDAERFGFTIVGAVLSVVAALLVNLLHYRRVGVSVINRE